MTEDKHSSQQWPCPPRIDTEARGFRLATTSFIYPDHYVPNVRMLAPYVDEIELLFFESAPPGSLPGKTEIRELASLAAGFGIFYNIHLPLDISLTAQGPGVRNTAVQTIAGIFDLAAPLAPSTWTLHLPEEDAFKNFDFWHERAGESISRLCRYIHGSRLTVETLSYPLQWIDDIISSFNLSICLDIGHMAIHGLDWESFYLQYSSRIPLIHLYGFEKTHEHLGLDRMAPNLRRRVGRLLSQFTGTLCLEVFSYEHLASSLQILQEMIRQDLT
ncbi:MAG: cobamide remodeling phosphodiesterase CbiR [Desulfosalsimonadaceae bacterium]